MSIKILVVDDQQDNIDLMCEMLEDNDMVALEAQNGHDALVLAKKEQPDVVVLDVQMPDMDGYEVCRQLKLDETTAHIPVIFLTATYSSEKSIVKGLDLGAYDYITKPFREAELLARIKVMAKIKKTEENVREESYTDALTGLYNRRFLEKRFSEELSRARRANIPLACLMLDIDHFKSINDIHGHDIGDLVLQDVSLILKKNLREYDTVARYGGEEFVIILPSTEYHDAITVAEKIRRAVEKIIIQKDDTMIHTTISIGVYGATGKRLEQNAEQFIRKADEALYRAKGLGRNRVVPHQDLLNEP